MVLRHAACGHGEKLPMKILEAGNMLGADGEIINTICAGTRLLVTLVINGQMMWPSWER